MPAVRPSATIEIDYPPQARSRWGRGHPGCAAVDALLERNQTRFDAFLGSAARQAPLILGAVPLDARDDDPTPRWRQTWLPASDAAALVTAIAGWGPAAYFEVGSGHSTRFARATVETLGLETTVVSIDPEPRTEIDGICDTLVRAPLEETDTAIFERLRPGDVVFFDGSHRCLQNSDVTVFFLDIVPSLAPGILVGVHDVFWPHDYPPGFTDRWYSEQYLLAAYLIGLGDRARVHLATHGLEPRLRDRLLTGIDPGVRGGIPNLGGASLWFETV